MVNVVVVYRRFFLDETDYQRYLEALKATGHKQAFTRVANDDDGSYTILEQED